MLYIDVREPEEFEKLHVTDSSNLPLSILEESLHLLPPSHKSVTFIIQDEQQRSMLPKRGRTTVVVWDARDADIAVESGACSRRCWNPNPALEAACELLQWKQSMPHGLAVDLACGSGRDLLFLLECGFVKPIGVDHLQAQIDKLPNVITGLTRDLESGDDSFRGLGPASLLNVSRYLCRELFPKMRDIVAPGGVLVYHTFYDGAQHVGKMRPRKQKFLLKQGELQEQFGEGYGFEVLKDIVVQLDDGRPTCVFISRKRPIPLYSLTATQLRGMLLQGDITCEQLMTACIGRIKQLNPTLNALVSVRDFGQLLEEARQVDRVGIDPSRSLHGIPIAIKDLCHVQGMRTTFGSPLYSKHISEADDDHVRLIKKHGALIVAKSNTPEFGAGSQTFNRVFGTTVNYYDYSKTVGGSSGGAACACAALMVPLADGSDLAGSLRNPAAYCNIFGFRPSARGQQMSTVGAMARDVEDIALLHSVMFGLALWELGGIPGGLRIAWAGDFGRYQIESEVLELYNNSRGIFHSLNCKVTDHYPDLGNVDEIFDVLRSESFREEYGELLASRRSSLKDTVIWQTERGLNQSKKQVADAMNDRAQLRSAVDVWFAEQADFIVCPSVQVVPFDASIEWVHQINGVPMSHYIEWMRICSCITTLGLPSINVPCGFTNSGLPVGIQVIGKFGADRQVLELAKAYQLQTATSGVTLKPPNSTE